jgi:hypothetical protein
MWKGAVWQVTIQIAVILVQRKPGAGALPGLQPGTDQGGLPVAGRSRDEDQGSPDFPAEPLKQPGAGARGRWQPEAG